MRRERTVRLHLRITPTMKARIERFTRELALPTISDLVIAAVAAYIDRQIALRGEAFVEIPEELRYRRAISSRATSTPARAKRKSSAPSITTSGAPTSPGGGSRTPT
jgi:hypothetical protein